MGLFINLLGLFIKNAFYPHRKEADPGRGLPNLRDSEKSSGTARTWNDVFFQALCRGVFAPLFPTAALADGAAKSINYFSDNPGLKSFALVFKPQLQTDLTAWF